MRFLLVISQLLAVAVTAHADSCPDYLLGLANPQILRFGGTKPRTPIQEMANTFLAHAPAGGEIQVAMPVFLEYNPNQDQQFGDGQRNGFAGFGHLPNAPFVAVLERAKSTLSVKFAKTLPGAAEVTAIEFSIQGQTTLKQIDANQLAQIQVDTAKLKWDGLFGAQTVFFRPAGWKDWFAVQFPYAYAPAESLVNAMPPAARVLPDGKSIIDPLNMHNSVDVQKDLQLVEDSRNEGFLLARAERVHGFYLRPDGNQVLTSNGGVWTRYRLPDERAKNVYLAKDPRVIDIEEQEGVVSGTGPHYIGAAGEIIVNSLGDQPLMTLYGSPLPAHGPDGNPLAWNFSHQWVGTWLRPGQAFVTPQGMYHWHLNHLTRPIAAQVLTPPQVPDEKNPFGF